MWRHAKPLLTAVTGAVLFAFVLNAAPTEEPRKLGLSQWEYKVIDLAVSVYPAALAKLGPDATPAQLEPLKGQLRREAGAATEWPKNIPHESVPDIERRLAELGTEGWELVLKDRNIVVFKRPKR